MSKTTKNDVVETVDTSIETSETTVDTMTPLAWVIKMEDGYHVKNTNGSIGDVCKIDKNNAICLTENEANRKWVMVKIVEAFFAENGDNAEYPLTYKETRTLGEGVSRSTKLPNEKLISYLPEAEQEEYKAIIARAIAARDAEREANKKKPMTEAEKAQAKVTKLIAQLKELGTTDEEIAALIAGINKEGGNA